MPEEVKCVCTSECAKFELTWAGLNFVVAPSFFPLSQQEVVVCQEDA